MMTGIVAEQHPEKQITKQMGAYLVSFRFLIVTRFFPANALTPLSAYLFVLLSFLISVLFFTLVTQLLLCLFQASKTITEQEKTVEMQAMSRELEKHPHGRAAASPDRSKQSPAQEPSTPTGNLPVFEFKEGSARSPWKFSKEAPRLSLDSRAVVDAKGSLKPREIRTNASVLSAKQCESNGEEHDDKRRSPSVIARLMGIEPLPDSNPEPNRKIQLRRSASEARGRDLFQYRFIDGVNFQLKQQIDFQNAVNGATQDRVVINNRSEDLRNARAELVKGPIRGMEQRKCFYDSIDFFPERKQNVSVYGDIEKRLKLRGIDEPLEDLDTLKQILEALQLKGLLHNTKKSPSQTNNNRRNIVYQHEQSPIVVIKPGRSKASEFRRTGKESPPPSYRSRHVPHRNLNSDSPPTMSPRRDQSEIERNVPCKSRDKGSISPARSECGVRSPNRNPPSVGTQKRWNDNVEQRRVSPVQSPRINVRRTGLDQTKNRLSKNTKSMVDIYDNEFIPMEDQTSTISESSISTSSQTDTERSNNKEGKTLLERCDKLLHSIAEMVADTTELQPSPVSVLDSSFFKEDSSPSPLMRRSIDFKNQLVESEDETWSPLVQSVESKSENYDFIYVSDILRASNYLDDDSDVFLLLEKQQCVKGKDTSKASRLQRKLIFDTINEILNRKKQLPPWKLVSFTNSGSEETSLERIWSEFGKIRESNSSDDDLFEVICGVLRKDLASDAINGWEGFPIEMSEAVLYIERLVFRDLIGETIRDLVALAGKSNNIPAPRRKLVFC